jgi:hypothetical protein
MGELNDGRSADTLNEQACLLALLDIFSDEARLKKLECRLSAVETRDEQDRLFHALDDIRDTLEDGKVLTEAQMQNLKAIASVAGFDITVTIGRGHGQVTGQVLFSDMN